VWFAEQSAECLADALASFDIRPDLFDPAAARRQALRFSTPRFAAELFAFLDGVLARPVDRARWAA
jgi:hypothetical protein